MFSAQHQQQKEYYLLPDSFPVLSATQLGHKIGNRCSSNFETAYALRHSLQNPWPQPGTRATYSSECSSVHTAHVNVEGWTFASASRSLRKRESSSSNFCCSSAKTERSSSSMRGGVRVRDGGVGLLGGTWEWAGRSGSRDGSGGHSESGCNSPL